ncbi:hypothetical protein QYF36_005501 [Acer negundo]|nr:hypothetical protein QYF36_005501 [Acer negundo]
MSHDSEIKFTLLSISRVSSSHRLYSLAAVETSLLPLPESSCVERATENPEASLSGVEPLMQKIRSEIRHVDAGILAAVCQQSNSGTKPKEDLAAATCAVEVNSLASAVEQLQVMASKRKYTEVAAQLEDVNQLCNHFEAYRDIPKMTELGEKFKNIKQILKSHVFSDFSRYVNGINMILTSSIPVLGSLLSPVYFRFFLDKMLLDTQAIKTILLDIPALGRQGLKKADQQSILDDFNKHGRGIKHPAAIVPSVAPPAAPAISPAMTASSPVGFIASREYVLTSAAAPG